MDFGEVLRTYLGADQQGQLVIKFVDEAHLCKISIENGQAIYLTLGSKGPSETLDTIVGKAAEWSNFIKGLPVRKRLDQPLNQLLLSIADAVPSATTEVIHTAKTEDRETTSTISATQNEVTATQVNATIGHFIDLIGPLGTILAENICKNLAYSDGSPMEAAIYSRFISALAAEVPDTDRQVFIDTATE